ncbi:MAG TPA: hypothetical protein VNR39_12470 [Pseudolabrys sp.]|nr:hypothetical protein [Pseudolabrys sp.]
MIHYADAENCLASVYRAAEMGRLGALRGRLKHLKVLGVPLNSNPGRGKRVLYTRDHVHQLAFCLELEEFGIDPSLVARVVKKHWKDWLGPGFEAVRQGKQTIYFVFAPQFMSSGWNPSFTEFANLATPFGFVTGEDVAKTTLPIVDHGIGRLSLFNVTKLLRQIEPAFSKQTEV